MKKRGSVYHQLIVSALPSGRNSVASGGALRLMLGPGCAACGSGAEMEEDKGACRLPSDVWDAGISDLMLLRTDKAVKKTVPVGETVNGLIFMLCKAVSVSAASRSTIHAARPGSPAWLCLFVYWISTSL